MKLNSLLRLATAHPQLVVEHVEAYAWLAHEELASAATAWKRTLLLASTAAAMAMLAIVFGGVALMLWASLPADSGRSPAVLIACPAVPAFIALCCVVALQLGKAKPLAALKVQLAADMAMLRGTDLSEKDDK